MTTRYEVLWCLRVREHDYFLTWGTDLRLYRVYNLNGDEELKTNSLRLSERTAATMVQNVTEQRYIKCIAWHPHPVGTEITLALGQANGQVALITMGEGRDVSSTLGRELVPKQPRPCNSLAWNPEEQSFLAVGLDRNRGDFCIQVWDAFQSSCPYVGYHPSMTAGGDTLKPYKEIGFQDSCQSLAYFPRSTNYLAAGINSKHVKIYDLRNTTKPSDSTPSKGVYGLCVDPFFEHRMASFSENQVLIWDTRKLEKPAYILRQNKMPSKISWCPTRRSLLGVLKKESSTVRLYDINTCVPGHEEGEHVVERVTNARHEGNITSFDWHKIDERRLLAVQNSGGVSDVLVTERVTMAWSAVTTIGFGHGKTKVRFLEYSPAEAHEQLGDVSERMRELAKAGYGLTMTPEKFIQYSEASSSFHVEYLWRWLASSQMLHDVKSFRESHHHSSRQQGVRDILCSPNCPSYQKSSVVDVPWIGFSNETMEESYACSPRPGAPGRQQYYSEHRVRALALCNWSFAMDKKWPHDGDHPKSILMKYLDDLVEAGHVSRAALIAILNLKLRKALTILKQCIKKGRDDLPTVVMALSGFTDTWRGTDDHSLWDDTCRTLSNKLQDPNLRTMFQFLTTRNRNYRTVLEDEAVYLEDRVATALLYLEDEQLIDWLDELTLRHIAKGDLRGILITGLTARGLDIIQKFLDCSGDVQTAAVVGMLSLKGEPSNDPRIQHWLQGYRSLLDRWHLWKERAMLDIALNKVGSVPDIQPKTQTFISCTFCGKPSSPAILEKDHSKEGGNRPSPTAEYGKSPESSRVSTPKMTNAPSQQHHQKIKVSVCVHCRKGLPRCCVCLKTMGTPSGCSIPRPFLTTIPPERLSRLKSWFTWCQSCRHGAHYACLSEWHKSRKSVLECPVSGCFCRCIVMDSQHRDVLQPDPVSKKAPQIV